MGIPQIIYIVLTAMNLGMALAKHGKPRENWNVFVNSASAAIVYTLLIWGGFFK